MSLLKRICEKGLAYTLTLVLLTMVLVPVTSPRKALADETMDALSAQVTETASQYNTALTQQKQLADEIASLDSRIAELERELPLQKARSDRSYRALYKYSSDKSGMLSLLLGAQSLSDALAMLDSFNWIISYNTGEIEKTLNMTKDLEGSRSRLESDKASVDEVAASAKTALVNAQTARKEAQQKAAATQKAEKETTQSSGSSSKKASSSASADNVNWSSSKSAFVAKWASRINSYLSGSPMAGTGRTYAAAAWDNGVDPRWAPAISYAESSKGAVCFRPYNAWGFGSSGFSSWADGINTVVSALGGSLYGGYLTHAAASTYCPSNPTGWYNTVSSQMSRI